MVDEGIEIRLDQLEIRLEQKLDQKLAHMATKAYLEIWGKPCTWQCRPTSRSGMKPCSSAS